MLILVKPEFIFNGNMVATMTKIANEPVVDKQIKATLRALFPAHEVKRINGRDYFTIEHDSITESTFPTYVATLAGTVYQIKIKLDSQDLMVALTFNTFINQYARPVYNNLEVLKNPALLPTGYENLTQLDLPTRNLNKLILSDAKMFGGTFDGSTLKKAVFNHAFLVGNKFNNTILEGADFTDADIRFAEFTGANIDGSVKIKSFKDADVRFTDFSGANLSGADLSGADFRHTILTDANLNDCNLTGTKFYGSTWEEAIYDDNMLDSPNFEPDAEDPEIDAWVAEAEAARVAAEGEAMDEDENEDDFEDEGEDEDEDEGEDEDEDEDEQMTDDDDDDEDDAMDGAPKCFDMISGSDKNIDTYLKKDRNNFIIQLPSSTNYECQSIKMLTKMNKRKSRGEIYYEVFYACTAARPIFGFSEADYNSAQPYIKLGSSNFLVEKPNWIYGGPPPEPRIFKLEQVGSKPAFVSASAIRGGDLTSDWHCNAGQMDTYKLVPMPVPSGGRKTTRKPKKTIKPPKTNKPKKTLKHKTHGKAKKTLKQIKKMNRRKTSKRARTRKQRKTK